MSRFKRPINDRWYTYFIIQTQLFSYLGRKKSFATPTSVNSVLFVRSTYIFFSFCHHGFLFLAGAEVTINRRTVYLAPFKIPRIDQLFRLWSIINGSVIARSFFLFRYDKSNDEHCKSFDFERNNERTMFRFYLRFSRISFVFHFKFFRPRIFTPSHEFTFIRFLS